MIGRRIEFKVAKTSYSFEVLNGTVTDKITDFRGHVARGWAISRGSNNVGYTESYTYYLVSEDGNGNIHLVYPESIIKIVNP